MAGVQAALVQVAQAQAVAALFQKANWDWNDPLSARSFEQWRDRQVHKTDEVTAVQNPQVPSEHLTRIRTVSTDGEVETASITLDTDNYEAVSERLEFRDAEWVELSEIAETSTESAGGSGAEPMGVPVRAAEPPSRPAAFSPAESASISDELQVLHALSGIGADLGELEDVSLSGGKVVVTAPGLPARRQSEIREAVANLPHVALEFTSVAPVSVPSAVAAAKGPTAGGTTSPIATRLEKHLGSHAEFDRFSTQLLDLEDAAMKQVFAVRNLAHKFSPEDEKRLGADDLKLLHELSRKHTAVLAEAVGSMETVLLPTLSSLGGTAASVHSAGHANWQSAAEDVYRSGRQVEELMSQMLGVAQGKASSNVLPSDLMAAMNELRANLDDCRKTLN